jgi:hypothetical protein
MLKSIPTTGHLSRLYYELSLIGASCAGQESKWPYGKLDKTRLLGLAAEMLRYDPRLLTILVTYCIEHYRDINPAAIRALYNNMQTPQTFAVLAEFIKTTASDKELLYWAEYLQRGLDPAPQQFFYHYLYMPGGALADRAVERNLQEYKKWGFIASERPTIDQKTKKTVGSLDRASRRNILEKLLRERDSITIADYITALDHAVSRQQALLDLKATPGVVCEGHGRGARWRLAA